VKIVLNIIFKFYCWIDIYSFKGILATFTLSGCGGDDAKFKSGEVIIPLVGITCVTGTPTATDIAGYETLFASDVIVKDEDNTTIAIYHDVDGLKKVCLVNGSAHIVR